MHRSHEDTDHDMRVGIPLPMPLVDGGGELERLRAVLEDLVPYIRDEDGDCVLCHDPLAYVGKKHRDRRHKPTCPMVELGFVEVDNLG